jgi:hypothetical protein
MVQKLDQMFDHREGNSAALFGGKHQATDATNAAFVVPMSLAEAATPTEAPGDVKDENPTAGENVTTGERPVVPEDVKRVAMDAMKAAWADMKTPPEIVKAAMKAARDHPKRPDKLVVAEVGVLAAIEVGRASGDEAVNAARKLGASPAVMAKVGAEASFQFAFDCLVNLSPAEVANLAAEVAKRAAGASGDDLAMACGSVAAEAADKLGFSIGQAINAAATVGKAVGGSEKVIAQVVAAEAFKESSGLGHDHNRSIKTARTCANAVGASEKDVERR